MSESIKAILASLPKGKQMLTHREVAEALGIKPKTINNWRTEKRADGTPKGPPWVAIEGKILYPRKGLEEYLWEQVRKQEAADDFVA